MIAASAEYAPPAEGLLDVVPVHFARGKSGGVEIRLGKRLCVDAPGKGARPSIRAQRLANALALDMLLQSGRYSSMSELARKLGITLRILQHHLPLLELSPAEMEEVLFETV
mgnify:CR=1 FL=1